MFQGQKRCWGIYSSKFGGVYIYICSSQEEVLPRKLLVTHPLRNDGWKMKFPFEIGSLSVDVRSNQGILRYTTQRQAICVCIYINAILWYCHLGDSFLEGKYQICAFTYVYKPPLVYQLYVLPTSPLRAPTDFFQERVVRAPVESKEARRWKQILSPKDW